jgi:hypothetical protein
MRSIDVNFSNLCPASPTSLGNVHQLGLTTDENNAPEHAWTTTIFHCHLDTDSCKPFAFWYTLLRLSLQNKHTFISSRKSTFLHWLRVQLTCLRANYNRFLRCCAVSFKSVAGLWTTIFCSRNFLLTRCTASCMELLLQVYSIGKSIIQIRQDNKLIVFFRCTAVWFTLPDEAIRLSIPLKN